MVFCNYTIYLPEQPFYPLLVFGILYSLHRLAPIIKKDVRVLVWVNLYLLEHTGKDFQSQIFLVS